MQRPEGRTKVTLQKKIPLGLLVAPFEIGISLVEKPKKTTNQPKRTLPQNKQTKNNKNPNKQKNPKQKKPNPETVE